MNEKNTTQNDDNWWASVLADENRHTPMPAKPSLAKDNPAPNWEKAQNLYKQDAIVSLRVTGHNRGGVLVEGSDLKGFVPYSHLIKLNDSSDPAKREKALAAYRDKTLQLKLIECAPENGRIIFSERAAQVGAGQRRELFSTLTRGKTVLGEVSNITDFGVFVDLGGVEGLIHISELSWGRVGHPSEIVQMREKIQVQILEISPERCRVALSMKRLLGNPWEKIHEKYQFGQIVFAEIKTLVPYGAFACLDDGIEGLIHNSEIPLDQQYLKEGDRVKLRVLQVDAKKQRVGLSLKIDGGHD